MERFPQIWPSGDRRRSSAYVDEPWFWTTSGGTEEFWAAHLPAGRGESGVGFGGALRQSSSLQRRPSELNISGVLAFPRLLFLRKKRIREGDGGRSMIKARYENLTRNPNILRNSYVLKTRISFLGQVSMQQRWKYYYNQVASGVVTIG